MPAAQVGSNAQTHHTSITLNMHAAKSVLHNRKTLHGSGGLSELGRADNTPIKMMPSADILSIFKTVCVSRVCGQCGRPARAIGGANTIVGAAVHEGAVASHRRSLEAGLRHLREPGLGCPGQAAARAAVAAHLGCPPPLLLHLLQLALLVQVHLRGPWPFVVPVQCACYHDGMQHGSHLQYGRAVGSRGALAPSQQQQHVEGHMAGGLCGSAPAARGCRS
jgi:hypothetical protein